MGMVGHGCGSRPCRLYAPRGTTPEAVRPPSGLFLLTRRGHGHSIAWNTVLPVQATLLSAAARSAQSGRIFEPMDRHTLMFDIGMLRAQ